MFESIKKGFGKFFKKKSEEIAKQAEGEERIEEKKKEIKKEEIDKEKKREGFFKKISKKLSTLKLTEEIYEGIWKDLEILLIENNVAIKIIEEINKNLKKNLIGIEIKKNEIERSIRKALKSTIEELFIDSFDLIEKIKSEKDKPYIISFFGINGSGKTTTIAKIASLLKKNSLSVIMAASDTFRAASIEQLEKHSENLDIKLIKQNYKADPAAVAFDAIAHAKSKNINVVLIDTAGRMHTNADLMREMEKICRVSKPNLKIFVGEATIGNDVIDQVSKFNESIGIDAIILTKADVDEKGGSSISASFITKKPIIYLGTGQKYDDLEKFDKDKILNQLGLD